MKKILFFAASAVVALASCTESDDFFAGDEQLAQQQQQENAITFGTYMGQSTQTRAGEPGSINTNILKGFDKTGAGWTEANAKKFGFGVFAYYTGNQTYQNFTSYPDLGQVFGKQTSKQANFMFNQQLWFNNSAATEGYVTKWTYSPMKYWPNEVQNGAVDDQDNDAGNKPAETTDANGGNLSFFAYAPYVALPLTGETTGITAINGKTTIDQNDDANEAKSDPIITYVVPTTGKDVVDLLWGTLGSAGPNVVSTTDQTGVGYSNAAGATNYEKAILKHETGTGTDGYKVPADLTKQKTNGKVEFAFKHALAKIGGSESYSQITDGTNPLNNSHGLLVDLLIDDQKGAEKGGTKTDDTKVTIVDVKIEGVALTKDASNKTPGTASYTTTYLKGLPSGDLNLATGQWKINNVTTTTESESETVTHIITSGASSTTDQDAKAGTLNADIAEPASWDATWTNNTMKGVETTAKNVYADEAEPLVFIPGTYPQLTITVKYIVRTKDENLAKGYSYVPQTIKKQITFTNPVELNKQYSLLMHLGLTSVKFDAFVSDWQVDGDTNGDGTITDGTGGTPVETVEKTEVNLPINVADAAAVVHATSTFKYTASTPGSNAYTPHGTTTIDGSTVNYTISKTEALTSEDGHNYIINDLARYLGSIWRIDNGETVKKITYDSNAYVWNSAGTNKGSNWVLESDNSKSLVSAITTALSSWLNGLTATDTTVIKLYLNDKTSTDPITINVTVTLP